jgi:transposase
MHVQANLFRVRTGIPWRDLPERYGPWQTVYKRFARWQSDGTWTVPRRPAVMTVRMTSPTLPQAPLRCDLLGCPSRQGRLRNITVRRLRGLVEVRLLADALLQVVTAARFRPAPPLCAQRRPRRGPPVTASRLAGSGSGGS